MLTTFLHLLFVSFKKCIQNKTDVQSIPLKSRTWNISMITTRSMGQNQNKEKKNNNLDNFRIHYSESVSEVLRVKSFNFVLFSWVKPKLLVSEFALSFWTVVKGWLQLSITSGPWLMDKRSRNGECSARTIFVIDQPLLWPGRCV